MNVNNSKTFRLKCEANARFEKGTFDWRRCKRGYFGNGISNYSKSIIDEYIRETGGAETEIELDASVVRKGWRDNPSLICEYNRETKKYKIHLGGFEFGWFKASELTQVHKKHLGTYDPL